MAPSRNIVIILSFLILAACAGMPPVRFQLGGLQDLEGAEYAKAKPPPRMQVVTSDREAGAAAREVLLAGGTAADAAVAVGFTLAVTLPSSAGLSSAGVCVARALDGGLDAVDFREALLPRGLFALHARSGARPWSSLVVSAETLARFGHSVSAALARDIETHGRTLATDGNTFAVFLTADRRLIGAGDEWRQPRLADSLARMRSPRQLEGRPVAGWFKPERKESNARLTPGTTGFALADANGAAVGCALTMGRPFGLGSMVRDGGYLFAAPSPSGQALDQLALSFLACIGETGESDKDAPACPAPAASFSLMP